MLSIVITQLIAGYYPANSWLIAGYYPANSWLIAG